MFIDTHCHIDDDIYTDKDEVVKACIESGVGKLICSGCDANSTVLSKDLAKKYPIVYYSAAIHPEHAETFTDKTVEELKGLTGEKCVAVGEIGLDYHYEPYDRKKQQAAFISLIELSNELKLPIVVHSRDAHADTLNIIKTHRPKYNGTMHCFSGSKEIAKEYLDLGFYLSFGGTLTFKNAVRLVEVLKYTPLDRVLTETDSPYLSPEPKRGQTNTPANIPIICSKIAELKNTDIAEVEKTVYDNALNLFTKLK